MKRGDQKVIFDRGGEIERSAETTEMGIEAD